ncbi:hypothetical protein EGR_06336 [Echinococcus granulosus]|uniref:Uncharacterized protein n=1 Tax=Echinococcus granulosus TaxID=6210 RepID=W6UL11_ECHGR|nr:hypothetical protein EGR_06336 [Echinococcus granulosus]EUB58787.1 hypothetical protein EGR_06336 [Echinococcus granulosus]
MVSLILTKWIRYEQLQKAQNLLLTEISMPFCLLAKNDLSPRYAAIVDDRRIIMGLKCTTDSLQNSGNDRHYVTKPKYSAVFIRKLNLRNMRGTKGIRSNARLNTYNHQKFPLRTVVQLKTPVGNKKIQTNFNIFLKAKIFGFFIKSKDYAKKMQLPKRYFSTTKYHIAGRGLGPQEYYSAYVLISSLYRITGSLGTLQYFGRVYITNPEFDHLSNALDSKAWTNSIGTTPPIDNSLGGSIRLKDTWLTSALGANLEKHNPSTVTHCFAKEYA